MIELMHIHPCCRRAALALVPAFALTALAGCHAARSATSPQVDSARLKAFAPIPDIVPAEANAGAATKVDLGRMLYYDPRFSRGQDISCNSCHPLDRYGADGQPTSEGFQHAHGSRNSPTVYNAAGHLAQFWDGRAATVEDQAKGPVLNPVEMAMPSEKAVVDVLESIPEYARVFHSAFPDDPDPLTLDNMAKAIAAFERKLVTPSRWDKFLRGDDAALTAEEKAGFNAFVEAGCDTCHAGTYVGGNIYRKLGIAEPWPDQTDPGRYQVTKDESDRFVVKVPSLRNVAKTGPYFHDGKVSTLEQAVTSMAQHQLGKPLGTAEVKVIVAWLGALTGEIPSHYIAPPALPKAATQPSRAGSGE
jgi:cytochrome c peroxidase